MQNLISTSSQEQTMSHAQIADLVKSRPDNVKASIKSLSGKGIISHTETQDGITGKNGVVPTIYRVNERDSYIVVAQLSPEFTAHLVDEWRRLKNQQPALPNFSDPVAAAEAWIEQYKATQLAIATKAEIGSRREATSMNTASQATKRANRLEIELDQSEQYATVKRMQMLYHGQKFKWQELKAASAEMDVPPIKVFDQNYGNVNSYHRAVWLEVYAIDVKGI